MEPITAPRLFQFVELGEDGRGQGRRIARLGIRPVPQCAARSGGAAPLQPGHCVGTPGPRGSRPPDRPQPQRIARVRPDARRSEDVLLTRFDAAALVPVLQGRQYLLVHVERASDILNVLGLKREFPSLKIVLVGATEGWTGRRPDRRVAASRSSPRRSTICPPASSSSRRPSRTSAGCAMPGSTSRSA